MNTLHQRTDPRLLFTVLLVVLGTMGLEWRLWQVQIVDGPKYAAQIEDSASVRVRLPPVRGDIRDRHGVLLAGNRTRFDVAFYLPEMVRAYREQYGGALPTVRYAGRVRGMLKMLSEPDIVEIVKTAVVPRLSDLGLPSDFDPEKLARHYRVNSEVPFPFVEDADFATVAKFCEHDLGLPGVRVEAVPVRAYLYGALAAHLLGYVGDPPDIATQPDVGEFDFYDPNAEGKAQVELLMDRVLRGTPGVRVMHRSAKGVIDAEQSVEPPKQGDTVSLTIDARIQFIAETALRAVGRAGAVVVDPRSGEILAMASVPSFDPNIFVPAIDPEVWKKLTKDETDPLTNRAISAFPPGSTFKVITALAGLRSGIAKKPFTCTGGVSYGDHFFQCWKSSGHGTLTLSEAIKVSCNAFFYQYGNAAGIDSIDTVGTLLGLGQAPGSGLSGEQTGVLPGPEWLRMHAPTERWSAAYTANVSIGQGYDLVSPLQLVLAYSAVANGGTAYYPRLIKKVSDAEGRRANDELRAPVVEELPQRRGELRRVGISNGDLDVVREGFWKVVNEDGGTARRARLAGGIVAGKTGTAQAQRHGQQDTIAWFVCFAPYDAPRYAVCVMVQGGAHGGSVAAPIAARILEETFAMERGAYEPPLAPLPPARHPAPFRMIESLDMAATIPQAAPSDEPAASPSTAATPATRLPKKPVPAALTQRFAPPPPPERPRDTRSFFERLFGPRPRH